MTNSINILKPHLAINVTDVEATTRKVPTRTVQLRALEMARRAQARAREVGRRALV